MDNKIITIGSRSYVDLDTDPNRVGNSDAVIPSQKAVNGPTMTPGAGLPAPAPSIKPLSPAMAI